jgi:hypothetical protein
MTYAEEQKIKNAEKAKRAKRYRYDPVLFDTLNPPAGRQIEPGTVVVKITMHGAPRNGTNRMCYIGDPETGEFIGLVMEASLKPIPKQLKGKSYSIRDGRTVNTYDTREELEL